MYMPATAQAILAALVADNRLPQPQADQIMTESLTSGVPIETILRQKRLVSEVDLAQARAKSLNVPFMTLAGQAIGPDIVNYISEPVARRYMLISFAFDAQANELSVAMV